MTIADLESKLKNVKHSGGEEFTALCPAHEDNKNSLSVSLAENGYILLKCHAGCETRDVCTELGFSESDLFPLKTEKAINHHRIVAKYDYQDADGKLIYQVVRTEPKSFQQRRPNGIGGWTWDLHGIEPLIYNLPEVLRAKYAGETIAIVEGEKDVHSLRSQGLTATTTSGGSGKNLTSSNVETVSGADTVVIIPDNDNPGVQYGQKWARALFGKVSHIKIVYLKNIWPGIPNKGDISDYLKYVEGKGLLPTTGLPNELADAIRLTSDYFLPDIAAEPISVHPHSSIWEKIPEYGLDEGRVVLSRQDDPRPLCTGSLIIRSQIAKYDGSEEKLFYEIEGIPDDRRFIKSAIVPVEAFAAMTWLDKVFGYALNAMPGRNIKEYLKFAIEQTGKQAGTYRHVTTYNGFDVTGKPIYYFHGGAVGEDSTDSELEIEALQRYHLSDRIDDLSLALEASLGLLTIHDPSVTIPLLCLTYLAPLRHILAGINLAPTFATFLLGATQAGKSTIAALFMCHFGTFSRTTPPASFTGTVNALRRVMYLIGDAPVWIDDYYPQESTQERRRMEQMAQSLVRAAGDGADRTRMNSSLTLQPGQPPRGLAVITGEDLPGVSQSGLARMFVIEVKRQPSPADLTQHLEAADAGLLRQAMRGYIEYIIRNWEDLPKILHDQYFKYKCEAIEECGSYGRLPEATAWLMLGGFMFTQFALDAGYMSSEEISTLMQKIKSTIYAAIAGQGNRVSGENPTRLFVQALRDLNNRQGLFQKINDAIADPQLYDREIGWVDDEFYYVNAGLAYTEIARHFHEQGREFPISKTELIKRLGSEKLISADTKGELSRTKRIGKKVYRFIFMPKCIIEEVAE